MKNYWTFDFGVRRFEQIWININLETLNTQHLPFNTLFDYWTLKTEFFYLNAPVSIANIWITNHSIHITWVCFNYIIYSIENHWNCSLRSNRMHLTILKYFITHLLFQLEIFDIGNKKKTTTQTQKYIITKNGIITFFGLSFIL